MHPAPTGDDAFDQPDAHHSLHRFASRRRASWSLIAIGIASIAMLLLASARPADAQPAIPECSLPFDVGSAAECELYTDSDLVPGEPDALTIVEPGLYSFELWAGGGAGGSGAPENGAGGGGGGGAYTLVELALEYGDVLTWTVGAGGAAPGVGEGGAGGRSSNVTVTRGDESITFAANGGTGGYPGVCGVGNCGSYGFGLGGNGGATTPAPPFDGPIAYERYQSNGSEGGASGGEPGGISTGGRGGDAAYGGDGGAGGVFDASLAEPGEVPGGGGGGGAGGQSGGAGGDGLLRIAFLEAAVVPTIAKLPWASIDGDFAWEIRVTNADVDETTSVTRTVRIQDADVRLHSVVGGGTCEADFDANGIIECEVEPGSALSLRVVRDGTCTVWEATNSIDGFWLVEGVTVTPLGYEKAIVRTMSGGNPRACWQPVITKTGLEHAANWFWSISIDNDPPGGSAAPAVDVRVEIEDSQGTLIRGLADGDRCLQEDIYITCDVEANETITFLVAREGPAPTCVPQYAVNAIDFIYVTFDTDGTASFDTWYLFDSPPPATAEVHRGEGYCLPDGYVIPLPVPDPVGDPPAPGRGDGDGDDGGDERCEVPAGVFSPAPVAGGLTIAAWGGGDVSDFPAATSFWTTVEGALIGYIPGAPAWVNAAFLDAFPGGEVPACTSMIVARR